MKQIVFFILFSTTFLFLSYTPAHSVMLPISLQKLVVGSDLVVRGNVIKKVSRYNTSQTKVYTTVTIHISDRVKGQYQPMTVDLQHQGGAIDGLIYKTTNTPEFTVGENALIFLKVAPSLLEDGSQAFIVTGYAQGKYTIDNNGIAAKEGFAIITTNGNVVDGTNSQARQVTDNFIPVDTLIQQIQSYAQ